MSKFVKWGGVALFAFAAVIGSCAIADHAEAGKVPVVVVPQKCFAAGADCRILTVQEVAHAMRLALEDCRAAI